MSVLFAISSGDSPRHVIINALNRLEIQGVASDGLGPISLQLDAGERVCLSGPSGSGKTRLLRMIADLDPHRGQVRLDGRAQEDTPPADWRRQVGLLLSQSYWWSDRVIDQCPDLEPRELEALGLSPALLEKPISQLSSGERQRFALLRLLGNEPEVLLLDEPTANLDSTNVGRIERHVLAYIEAKGSAALWVSHDDEQIARVASRALRLRDGEIE